MTLSLFDEIGILICILIAIVSNDGLEISLRLMSRSPSDMARLFPWTGRVDGPRLEFGRKSFLLEGQSVRLESAIGILAKGATSEH